MLGISGATGLNSSRMETSERQARSRETITSSVTFLLKASYGYTCSHTAVGLFTSVRFSCHFRAQPEFVTECGPGYLQASD